MSRFFHPALFIYLLMLPLSLYGQDGHYWTEQYGTRSTLLGGAVIGSVDDLGAIYYNPARLAMLEDPGFVLSARIYELRRITIEDALGENLDLSESDFGGAPDMVAGSFDIDELEGHRFGYSFLTRHESDSEFLIRTGRRGDIIDGIPGDELFTGEVNWNKSLEEEWLGFSWSYQPWPGMSLGLTHFFTLRSQESLFKIQLQALSENDDISFLARNRQNDFESYGMRWKMGLAFDLAPVSAGLTLTTPKVHLLGDGTFLYEDFFSGIETNDDKKEDVFLTDFQDGLKVRHKSPLSIGVGLGLSLGRLQLHSSAEWFSGIPEYSIMRSEPFVGQSSRDTLTVDLVENLEGLVNFGFGLEMDLGENFSAYSSFATDHSAVKSSIDRFVEFASKTNNSVIRANLYHLAGGFVCHIRRAELTLGGAYSFASQEIFRPVDFPEEDGEIIFGSRQTSTVEWRRWRLIFGFSMPFGRKAEEK